MISNKDNRYISNFNVSVDEVNPSFFKEYIKAFNSKLDFTSTEIDLLSEILYYNYTLNPDIGKVELSSKARRVISKKLGISVYNFNNVFQRLKNRNVFSSTDEPKVYTINIPVFGITPKSGDEYLITYSFEIK